MNISRFIPLLAPVLFAAPAALAQVSPMATLDAHNTERSNYPGVGPLQWSPELAQYAQQWAAYLAERDIVPAPHRSSTTDNLLAPGQYAGENLFWGDGRPYTTTDAVQSWIAEKHFYHYELDDGYASSRNSPPGCSASPPLTFCGHFTQVIWKNTQFVGCGRGVAADGTVYIVCNYYPAGNYGGQKPF